MKETPALAPLIGNDAIDQDIPVRRRIPLAELKAHVFTLPDQPDLIPYRTSCEETWGFCMSHRQLAALEAAGMIESRLEAGAPTWGE